MADPQQDAQLTLEQFGQKIKSKYPQYQSLSDTDIANKVLAKYPQYKSSVRQNGGAGGSWEPLPLRDRLTRIEKPDRNAPAGKEVLKAIGNVGAGAMAPILHPVDTLESIGGVLTAPFEMAAGRSFSQTIPGEMVEQFKENPLGTIEAGIGGAATTETAVEVAPRIAKAIPKAAENTVRSATGTAPRALKPFIESTEKANTATLEANAKQASARAAELRAHYEKLKAARTAEEARSTTETRKAGLQSGASKLGDTFQTDLRSLRDSEAAKAGAKFNALNAELDEESAHTEFLPNALAEASEKIKGSNTEPTILRDMEQKLNHGDVLTYRDLQGYYSELGRELQKGSLQGDVYHAYSTLQDTIGDEMQRIADSKGLGEQLTDARQSWRSLKQTFYDPKSPLRKSLDAREPGGPMKSLAGKDRTGIGALAKYDPKLAQKANTIRGYAEEARTTKIPASSTKAVPELKPKPQPAPLKQIDVGDIQNAKAENLTDKADKLRRGPSHFANTIIALDAIRSLMTGNLGHVGMDIGARVIYGAGKTGLAKVLERPTVVNFLTKATPQDVAAIPADLRGPMAQVIAQAQTQGVQVSPALSGMGATGALGVAPRKHPSDEYAGH